VDGATGTATVNVTVPPPAVDSVVVTDDGAPPIPGAQVQLTATVWAGGAPDGGATVTWSGGTPGIATIDANGLVTIDPTALPGQQATFTATDTADGVPGSLMITVQ
jgi:hypothetical protein